MSATQKPGTPPLKDRAYSRKEVVEIIRSVMGTMDKESKVTSKLHEELNALATYIESMRAELAQMRSVEISGTHIPTATDELDAVVEETAKATGTILDVCEKIEKTAEKLASGVKDDLANACTTIYEACNFQDVTGQRITKVVKTLKHIEVKVSEILDAFGHDAYGATSLSRKDEEGLLHGPQLKTFATSQEDIDKLLASFDK